MIPRCPAEPLEVNNCARKSGSRKFYVVGNRARPASFSVSIPILCCTRLFRGRGGSYTIDVDSGYTVRRMLVKAPPLFSSVHSNLRLRTWICYAATLS